MSKFIQIGFASEFLHSNGMIAPAMFVLDDEGTIWKRALNNDDQPFEAWAFSPKKENDAPKPKKEKAKKAEQPFHEWFNEIKHNDAYKGIDCNKELGKMKAWMLLPKNKNRKLTKRFVLNWLNKVEPDIEAMTRTCYRHVRKEGFPFLKECGEPATDSIGGAWFCFKCAEAIRERTAKA